MLNLKKRRSLCAFAGMAMAMFITAMGSAQARELTYHYAGDIRINPETGHLSADWTISILKADKSHISFAVRNTLDDIDVGGDIADWTMMPEGMPGMKGMLINLAPAPEDDTAPRQITLSYAGDIFSTPVNHNINEISPQRIELNIDGFWMPFDLSVSGLLTAEVTFTIKGNEDGRWKAVTTGETRYEDGRIIIHNTRPSLDIAVAMSPAFRLTQGDGFAIYDNRASDERIDELQDSAKICTAFLNAHYGATDPLPEGRFVLDDRTEGGYSRQNMISFSSISKGDAQSLTEFVCHELAHFWSSNGNFQTVENWLNEGFAVYVAALAARETYGEDAYNKTRQGWQEAIEGKDLPPVWVPGDTQRKPFLVNYRKSAIALAGLEDAIGRDAMTEFVRRYMVDGIATTPDLIAMLEDVAGADARVTFEGLLAQ